MPTAGGEAHLEWLSGVALEWPSQGPMVQWSNNPIDGRLMGPMVNSRPLAPSYSYFYGQGPHGGRARRTGTGADASCLKRSRAVASSGSFVLPGLSRAEVLSQAATTCFHLLPRGPVSGLVPDCVNDHGDSKARRYIRDVI